MGGGGYLWSHVPSRGKVSLVPCSIGGGVRVSLVQSMSFPGGIVSRGRGRVFRGVGVGYQGVGYPGIYPICSPKP